MAKVIQAPELEDEEMQQIYEWVDEVPLSRPKRNITRDFADGVLLAEIVHHYHPKLIELHNYPQAHSVQQKMTNWNLLNAKVFRRLGFQLSRADVEQVVNAVPNAIEKVLHVVKQNLSNPRQKVANPVPQPARVQALVNPKASAQERSPIMSSAVAKEKDVVIEELKETVEIMEAKILKLEQLVKLKDSKIDMLTNKLAAAGLT